MTYFSAFSGVGGFELALTGHTCVGASEIDRYAAAVYRAHFPHHHNYGDIRTLESKRLPKFDLLVAGFPCQAFSTAGKRLGLADPRGALFIHLARLVAAKRPRLLLLENVKGLLSHARGETFRIILGVLDELGYDAQWEVRNAREYVPQNRERVFIVGHRRGTHRPKVFPLTEAPPDAPAHPGERAPAGSMSPSARRANAAAVQQVAVTFRNGAMWPRAISTALVATYGRGIDGHGERTAIYEARNDILLLGGIGPPRPGVTDPRRGEDWTQQYHLYGADGISPAMCAKQRGSWVLMRNGGTPAVRFGWSQDRIVRTLRPRIRRLTPLECERLMSWPDEWTRYGVDETGKRFELSATRRYELCGNGVVSACVRPIIQRLT